MSGAALQASQLTTQQMKDICWRTGNLRYLCKPEQVEIYDAFHRWMAMKNEEMTVAANNDAGALYDNMMTWLLSRRYGKTTLALILITEFMIRNPGCTGIITTSTRAAINPIVMKAINDCMRDEAPAGYLPTFRGSWLGLNDVLVLPATESYARFVGLDLYADRLRGPSLDFFLCTEAGYCNPDIAHHFRSVIAPQFRGRPNSFALFESSYAETQDHPLHSEFAHDSHLRGALIERNILDQGLSDTEIQKEENRSGGHNHPTTRRELYNEHAVDPTRQICPPFSEANIVPADYPIPVYGYGIVALDPGTTDDAGMCFMLLDTSKHEAIIQWSYGAPNINSAVLTNIVRSEENRLWGTTATVEHTVAKRSLADILKSERAVPVVKVSLEQLSIDNTHAHYDGTVWDAPPGTVTWWDDARKSLRPNPARRLMDVQSDLKLNMRQLHGLNFESIKKGKGNMQAMIDNLNIHLAAGSIKILNNEANQSLIKQLRNGKWNAKRTDFERIRGMGHFDILVAAAIAARAIDWSRDVRRPRWVDPVAGYNQHIMTNAARSMSPAELGGSNTGHRVTQRKKYR